MWKQVLVGGLIVGMVYEQMSVHSNHDPHLPEEGGPPEPQQVRLVNVSAVTSGSTAMSGISFGGSNGLW